MTHGDSKLPFYSFGKARWELGKNVGSDKVVERIGGRASSSTAWQHVKSAFLKLAGAESVGQEFHQKTLFLGITSFHVHLVERATLEFGRVCDYMRRQLAGLSCFGRFLELKDGISFTKVIHFPKKRR